MREHQEELDRSGAVVVAVTFELPSQVARFAQTEALTYPVLSDPTRRAYAAFGLQRGRPGQIWSWNTLKAYVRGMLQGRWPRLPHGDLAQLGGDFVLDRDGAIVFAHLGEGPAERPTIEDVLAAVRRAAYTARDGEDR